MKLIEALIVAQQEYGIYGDWKAIHGGTGCSIGRAPRGVYLALDMTLISQSDRLETVISDFAGRYPDEALDGQWKVPRWD